MPLGFWSNLFLEARAEILKKIVGFGVQTLTPKSPFEINWPLAGDPNRVTPVFFTEIDSRRGIVWYSILILTTFLQDQDIFVASFPKSGTTWLQQVVYLLFHPDNPDSELMEWKFPYLEHVYPGKKVLF